MDIPSTCWLPVMKSLTTVRGCDGHIFSPVDVIHLIGRVARSTWRMWSVVTFDSWRVPCRNSCSQTPLTVCSGERPICPGDLDPALSEGRVAIVVALSPPPSLLPHRLIRALIEPEGVFFLMPFLPIRQAGGESGWLINCGILFQN